MNKQVWISLHAASAWIDVPVETISHLQVPWQQKPVPHRIRYRLLKLGEDSKGEPRYFAQDVEGLLTGSGTATEAQPSEITAGTVSIHPRNRFKKVERGIYRDRISQNLFERPFIGGRRTTRSLGTNLISKARVELRRRKSARESDDAEPQPSYLKTVGEVIRYYQEANYPDKQLNPRSERTTAEEKRHCVLLLRFWSSIRAKQTSIITCDSYRDWRLRRIRQGTGLRTIDRELLTLNNAFRFAYRKGQVGRNPLVDRPRYQPSRQVAHCRQFMPGDSSELHEIARLLFRTRTSEVLGFQLLFTAYTGQRTCEALKLKTDAGPDEPGRVMENGKCLRVWRAKGQDLVNPFCSVHDGLNALIAAHRQWIAVRYPEATWYFPGRVGADLVDKHALAHALRRLRKKGLLSRRITPHGARAFFVTVRRSQGAPDSQIAIEIGHTSGGSTLSSVYGGVPPEWVRGGGPKMSWLPPGLPAWWDLLLALQKVSEARNSSDCGDNEALLRELTNQKDTSGDVA